MRLKCLLFSFLFFPFSFVNAQTATELDRMLETKAVTVGFAARFAMDAAGLLPEGLSSSTAETVAYEVARHRGWVKGESEDTISLQDMAFLLVNVFEIKGGLVYRLFPNPRYAYREMIYRRLIQGRSYSNMELDGPRFLQILGRTLNYTGERERMDAMLIQRGAYR